MAPKVAAILTVLLAIAVAMLQGNPVGRMLLHGVRKQDLQRERQQLAQVRMTHRMYTTV